jgi:Zn-dependent protease
MNLTTRLGRIAGIDVRVHATFWLLLGFAALVPLLAGKGLAGALGGALFIAAMFGIVVLHELGHALAARRYGIATLDITLLPIGGVARLERMPESPRQEIVVALAGPAVNLALALVLLVGVLVAGVGPWLGLPGLGAETFLTRLFWANLLLAAFNLIPAFPMDGGRVLRALLALRLDRVRATWIAARIGQGFAVLLGLLGLVGNPLLMLIALFVWFGAEEEAQATEVSNLLRDVPVGELLVTEVRVLSPDEPVAAVAAEASRSFQRDFPVVTGDYLVGTVSRTELLLALHEGRLAGPVAEIMQRAPVTAEVDEPASAVLARLDAGAGSALPVTRAGRFVGMLPLARLVEHVAVSRARPAPANSRSETAPVGTRTATEVSS